MLPLFGGAVIIPGVRETQPNRGACLIRVKVRMNESLDQLLKRFKKACDAAPNALSLMLPREAESAFHSETLRHHQE